MKTFQQMQDELGLIVQDSLLVSRFPGWINDAILEVATDYDLPPLKLADPVTLTVDSSKWLWLLPEVFKYHKHLFLAKGEDASGNTFRLHIFKDPTPLIGKDHTITGPLANEVAVIPQGDSFYLGIFPLPQTTQPVNLWFYRLPAVLTNAADVCDCIPFNFISQVVYPKIIIKNYQFIVDQVQDFPFQAGPLQYWQGELRKGLFGAPGQGTGLISYFNQQFHPPRTVGSRSAIGWRPYNFGGGF